MEGKGKQGKELQKARVMKKSGVDLCQRKLTDYVVVSPVMKLCVELAVHKGTPFSTFDDPAMRKLLKMAKIGSSDNSNKVINAENVKQAVIDIAASERQMLINMLDRRVISLSSDMATCEGRSFIDEF